MQFSQANMSFSYLTKLLEYHYKVALGNPTSAEYTTNIIKISDSHLIPKTNRYPSVYYFDDIEGQKFIAFKNDGMQDALFFTVKVTDSEDEAEYLSKLNAAERFIVDEAIEWEAEDTYPEILEHYGLSDYYPQIKQSQKIP